MKLQGKSRDAEQGSTWDSQLWFDCKFSPNSQFWSVWHSVCPHCTLHLDTPGLHFIDFIFQMKIRRGNEWWSSAMHYIHYSWSYPVDMGTYLWGNIDFQCFMVSLSTTPWKLSCVWWKNYQMENWRCSAVQIFSEQDHYCGETSLDPGAGYETSPVGDLTFS